MVIDTPWRGFTNGGGVVSLDAYKDGSWVITHKRSGQKSEEILVRGPQAIVPKPTADPIQYLISEMLRRGWHNKDLVGVIGTRARVSEVLTGKRGLSISMIRRLVFDHGLSAEKLISSKEGEHGPS